ncbi:PREDICTED: zinc finger CCCH domain-containing protein 16 isoform X2 [Nelumbo nucifera]|uniref:Zinc finger CCCH domain-containing protein 16 isoform X2 n=2 Tax=Nelumbo nucifera TaxID=4432 RepID=A0A1U8BAX8_NELNU|nr:PREDICTED: zinc finger CCCH domain-containing protein 16 isoform X2 [Nelumbo nucifera]DAD46359.1 TPA_asm: hypothetical protein HUJ06_004589 [Nelumbo nucifera]
MYRKKEPCRNFQRGSCQYGERCKFLHVTQQQPKPNPFGFGTGSQYNTNQSQQKPNPFGFGVQSSSQSKGAFDFSAKNQNQFKPFENKWVRSSTLPLSSSRQADNQAQVPPHKCTDPESCKQQIVEDFEHERPLWNLTCYGHCKYHPCDIVGDISYEELRAAAYDGAKNKMSLESIVQRERSLLNSKLIEFENLLRNPYVKPNSVPSGPSPFPGTNSNVSPVAVPNNMPPSMSSFSQLGTSLNLGSGTGASMSLDNPFIQASSFQNSGQTSSGLGVNISTFRNEGSLWSQQPVQPLGSASKFNISNSNNNFTGTISSQFSTSSAVSAQLPSSTNWDSNKTAINKNASIWQEEWNPGEIPEEAPPDEFL